MILVPLLILGCTGPFILQAVAAAKKAGAAQAPRDKHGVEVAAVVALSVLVLAGGVATAVCRAN